jgi:hypothetical protein
MGHSEGTPLTAHRMDGRTDRTALGELRTHPAGRTARPLEAESMGRARADPLLRAGHVFASGRRYPGTGNSEAATPSLRAFSGGIHLRDIAPMYSHPHAKESEIHRGLSWAKLVTLAAPARVARLVTTETTLRFLVRGGVGARL